MKLTAHPANGIVLQADLKEDSKSTDFIVKVGSSC